jgi:hypothetical protein
MSEDKKKRSRKRRNLVTQEECIKWVAENVGTAIVAREGDWCWLVVEDYPEATQKKLRDYGFIKKNGARKLKCGDLGYWGHSCMAPTKFKFKKRGEGKKLEPKVVEVPEEAEVLLAELGELLA